MLCTADINRSLRSFAFLGMGLLLLARADQANAQMIRVDSLRTQLKTDGRSTLRVDHLIGLAFAISDAEFATGYDEIVNLLEEANALTEELKYPKGQAYAPMASAFQAMNDGRYSAAITGYTECISRLDAQGIEQGMASPLADIRRVYTAAGMQQERFVFYRSALDRYRRTGPALNATTCEHGLGGYYLGIRQYGQAIEHYMKAREGFRSAALWSEVANETSVIGQCYVAWGNPERGEPFLHEAFDAFVQEKNLDQAFGCAMELGDLELSRGNTLEAARYYRSTRPYWNGMSPLRIGMNRTRLVIAFVALGQLDSAAAELQALNTLYAPGTLPLWTTAGECEVDYANYRFQKAMGQNALADSCLEKALNEAMRFQYMALVLKYRKELSERYLELGDMHNAAIQARTYISLNDSLHAQSNRTSIAVYEGQVKERESELALQQQQERLRQQRIISFSIAGGLLLLVALAFTVYRGKKRSDELLLNILPEEVANELKTKGHADAKHFDQATILFTDFKGFTEASEKLSPQELVEELNTCFKAFDQIITLRGIEKIKTIGDAYMCAGGLPDPKTSTPAAVVHAALEMQAFVTSRKTERDAIGKPAFEMRVGIHTGPVVAGIVGVKKFQYDIWGDTVNTASRMESSGEVGQVNISEATYALVREVKEVREEKELAKESNPRSVTPQPVTPQPGTRQPATEHVFTFTPRGKVQAKGKGEMEMYFVRRSSEGAKRNFVLGSTPMN